LIEARLAAITKKPPRLSGGFFIGAAIKASKIQSSPKCKARKKIPPRRIWVICKQEIFYATPQLG